MTDVEGIERRSESPSTRTRSSSRLSNMSNQEVPGDSDMREPVTKKRSSKRINRNSDKENGEEDFEANGVSDELPNGVEEKEPNTIEEQNSVEPEELVENGCNGDLESENVDVNEGGKPINGDGQVETASASEAETSPKEAVNDSTGADTEESYFTADTDSAIPAEKKDSGEPKEEEEVNGNSEENGFELDTDEELKKDERPKTEPRKGILSKWSFNFSNASNGHSNDSPDLYYSSIRGRVPLSRASPKPVLPMTPNNTRNLDDSFVVKSEPSRTTRSGPTDKPNLRKFPAKRCLNADEPDDGFVPSLNVNKRRKLDGESRTGFLRNFLWSPFKRNITEGNAIGEANGGANKSSWFRSSFWFWKRCSRDEERN